MANERKRLIAVGKSLFKQGLIVAREGNLSVRMGKDRMLITRSMTIKGTLTLQDFVDMDFSGKPRVKSAKPSSEWQFHQALYRARPDIHAIVHAHPPHTIACSLAGLRFDEPYFAETVLALSPVPTVPYTTPASIELAHALAAAAGAGARAVILERHGVVAMGQTPEQALEHLELLEQTARILILAKTLKVGGEIRPLTSEQIRALKPSPTLL